MADNFPKVGVQAVVEGAREFVSDMNEMNASIKDFLNKTVAGRNDLGQFTRGVSSMQFGLERGAQAFQLIATGASIYASGMTILIPIVGAVFSAIIKLIGGVGSLAKAFAGAVVSAAKKLLVTLKNLIFAVLRPGINIVKAIAGSFQRFAETLLAFLTRDLIGAVGRGIKDLAVGAFNAAREFQRMEIQLQGLLAREIAQGVIVEETTRAVVSLTDKERLRRIELEKSTASMTTNLEQMTKAYADNFNGLEDNSEGAIRARIAMDELSSSISSNNAELSKLSEHRVVETVNKIAKGAMSMGDAMGLAGKRAGELFDWVARLGIKAPFGVQDIARTLTLASSYGFATERAKELTEATVDFSSGMGLTQESMSRVIENMGQMVAQGKITGTELRDLGRSAFVPINDLLIRTAESLGIVGAEAGITAAEINDFAKSKGLDPVEAFVSSFIAMVDEDFEGAAERMSKTLDGLVNKLGDVRDVIFGFNLLKPTIDTLSAAFSEFLGGVTGEGDIPQPAGGTRVGVDVAPRNLGDATKDLGATLKKVAEDFVAGFDASALAQKIVFAFDSVNAAIENLMQGDVSGALEALRIPDGIISTYENVKQFFEEFGGPIKESLIELGEELGISFNFENLNFDGIIGFVQSLSESLVENGPQIIETIEGVTESISSIKDILGGEGSGAEKGMDILSALGVDDATLESIQEIIDKATELKDFIMENSDTIVAFIMGALGPVLVLVGLLVAALWLLAAPFLIVTALVAGLVFGLMIFSGAVTAAGVVIREKLAEMAEKFRTTLENIGGWIDEKTEGIRETFDEWSDDLKEAGKNAIEGLLEGLKEAWVGLVTWLESAAASAMDLWNQIWGNESPSKEFAKIGVHAMSGLAMGISKGASLPIAAMESVAAALPGGGNVAFAGAAGVTSVTNYNVELNPQYTNVESPGTLADDVVGLLQTLRT